ncbi:putative A C2HC-type zinc-finger protein [Paratrimastix pyriformis]|uniref:A C2HC-type zinc-finger protein n=1 Tax=Paratrimastix pyriformis TaxID=342808 RepID=A0ABQ8UNP6_9EUKA|nr:putative A C2HC-type zinc-finger protein [Paratrimastix pyriformis]
MRAVEAYNQAAWAISQQALNDCPFCHRRFNPDALAGHLNSCSKRDGQDPFSPPGKSPGATSRPRMLVCYICGREYGSASLPIHQKQCMERWQSDQAKLPPEQRRPLPRPPTEAGLSLGTMNQDERDQFNEAAFKGYTSQAGDASGTMSPNKVLVVENQLAVVRGEGPRVAVRGVGGGTGEVGRLRRGASNLEPCPNCGRRFNPEALKIHLRSCRADRVLSPLKPQAPAPAPGPASPPAPAAPTGGGDLPIRRGAPAPPPDEGTGPAEGDLVPCAKCGRRFAADRIARHEATCKAERRPPPQPEPTAQAAMGQGAPVGLPNRAGFGPSAAAPPMEAANGAGPLEPCPRCGRRFAPERLPRHMQACKGTVQAVRAHQNDVALHPITIIHHSLETCIPRPSRAPQAPTAPSPRDPLSSLPPPPPDPHDDYVECRYCGRRFAPDRAEKHINACRNIINRPRRPRTQHLSPIPTPDPTTPLHRPRSRRCLGSRSDALPGRPGPGPPAAPGPGLTGYAPSSGTAGRSSLTAGPGRGLSAGPPSRIPAPAARTGAPRPGGAPGSAAGSSNVRRPTPPGAVPRIAQPEGDGGADPAVPLSPALQRRAEQERRFSELQAMQREMGASSRRPPASTGAPGPAPHRAGCFCIQCGAPATAEGQRFCGFCGQPMRA